MVRKTQVKLGTLVKKKTIALPTPCIQIYYSHVQMYSDVIQIYYGAPLLVQAHSTYILITPSYYMD